MSEAALQIAGLSASQILALLAAFWIGRETDSPPAVVPCATVSACPPVPGWLAWGRTVLTAFLVGALTGLALAVWWKSAGISVALDRRQVSGSHTHTAAGSGEDSAGDEPSAPGLALISASASPSTLVKKNANSQGQKL